jgi:hypothetical protein
MATKVSLGFAKLPDQQLDNFAQSIVDSMTGNASYPAPPVTMADLQAAKDDFTNKLSIAQTGGQADTAAKNNSRQTLQGMLRLLAVYVQMMCGNDLAVLLSSGFQPQSTNRASVQLAQPQGLNLKNGVSGQLVASVNPVPNTNMYEGRIKADGGDWMPSVFTSDSQHIYFNNLTPGTMYTAEVRSLGGATGQSDWSDPSSHRAL